MEEILQPKLFTKGLGYIPGGVNSNSSKISLKLTASGFDPKKTLLNLLIFRGKFAVSFREGNSNNISNITRSLQKFEFVWKDASE